MRKLMRIVRRNEHGAALVEYALIVAGVALIGAAAVALFGHKVSDMLGTVAAVMPGAHAEDNAPIVVGRAIETSANAQGVDQGGNNQQGIGLDVNAIMQGQGTSRLADGVGGDGAVSSLVLEPRQ